jgi:DNA-binding SARP family transcriptional activator/tetratricopeptide (TPR) repeat protein
VVDFRVLGPVEVSLAGERADTGHTPQCAVLAVLLLNTGRSVPLDVLIDRVWGEDPPRSARNLVYGYVGKLRALVARGDDPAVTLCRRQDGYRLQAEPDQVDVHRFRRLVAEAAGAATDDDRAAALLGEAVALWRGPALAGLDSPFLNGMRVRLELERAAAVADLNDIRLRRGEHRAMVGELAGQAAASPADERLIGQLMLALYRSGQQAEALHWFEETRKYLAEQLGVDPGPELGALHAQMLRADRSLVVAPPADGRVGAATPRELPADVPAFTGRRAELAELDRLLAARAQASAKELGAAGGWVAAAVISVVSGTAGVGKTALALHWAHQVADWFPDGQLYVNLRGFDPGGIPVAPAEAIRGFLDSIGVPPDRIPPKADAQAGLYRSLLAGRQMLIVIDNARDEQQVRPLLPASPGSLVQVTSRGQLAGLAAADGARLLTLDVLPEPEARQLLAARLGSSRVAAEPGAVTEIASLCACLPLALAVAAARAAARPHLPLAALADELRDSSSRLDALDTGDPVASVRAVFSWSYQQLSPGAAEMFRLLGMHPGPDITVPAAASLVGSGQPQARRRLAELTRAHLVAEHRRGRYALHDLLRAYAAGETRDTDSDVHRNEAVARLLDHYLHSARTAALVLTPTSNPKALHPPRPGVTPEQLDTHQQAVAWFEAEHQVLAAAAALADSARSDAHAWQIPWTMLNFLDRGGHWQEWAALQRTAVAAAVRLGDVSAQITSFRLMAAASIRLADYESALAGLMACLPLCEQAGSQADKGYVHYDLAFVAENQERYADALEHAEQALDLFQAAGHQTGQASSTNAVGWYRALLGDHQQACAILQQSLALHRQLGSRFHEACCWGGLGYAQLHLGDYAEAASSCARALGIFRELGDRLSEATVLDRVGDVHHAAGEPAQARDAWQQALDILVDLHHPDAEKVRAKRAG